MNCYLHPETTATAYCRSCGRPLCSLCQRTSDGTVFCADHAPVPGYMPGSGTGYVPGSGYTAGVDPNAPGASNPYFQAAAPAANAAAMGVSPGLAFVLGLFPGVGAIYNGQYVKGLVHAIIFGLIISLLNSVENRASEPVLAILLAAFVIYMPFEAFHTAKNRQMGIPVDEWSSLAAPGAAQGRFRSRAPIGPMLLIALGVLFLLDTLTIIQFNQIGRFWPVLLIVLGAFMLYNRVAAPSTWVPPSGTYPNNPANNPGAPPPENPSATPYAETRHE